MVFFITPSRPPQGGAEEKRRALAGTFNRRSPPSRSPSGGRREEEFRVDSPLGYLCPPAQCPRARAPDMPATGISRACGTSPLHWIFRAAKRLVCLLHASYMPPTCLLHASHRMNFPTPVPGGDRRHQPAAPAHRPPHPAGDEKSPAHARLP